MNLTLPRRGDELELVPTEVDDEGLALARLVLGQGEARRRLRVMIRGAVPGDRVIARVESRVRDDLFARVARVLTPSPERVAPRCRHAIYQSDRPFCGGCTLQAVSYERQLALKHERVRRALASAGVALEVAAPRPAPLTFHHRHKMELSFHPDVHAGGEVALGLHPPGYKWEVVSLAECPLLSPEMSAMLPALEAVFKGRGLRAWDPRRDDSFLRNLVIREAKRTGERLLELVTTPRDPVETHDGPRPAGALVAELAAAIEAAARAHGVTLTSLLWTCQHAERGRPTRFVTTTLAGKPVLSDALEIRGRRLDFDIDPRSFFQPHPRAAEGLVDEVLARLVPSDDASTRTARLVLDLYCGTGTLALSVAPFVGQVIGVELVAEAVADARRNAALNQLANTRFIAGDVAATIGEPAFREALGELDALLVDPPRAGLSPPAFEAISALDAPRIVYVSCKPESLARDLRRFHERGYDCDRPAQPVDLFPQSHHVETVVSLSRRA